MFENYKQLSADEKAHVKSIHKALRREACTRHGALAWAFVRGFPYRRVERKTRTQVMPDGSVVFHNRPSLHAIAKILQQHIPGAKFMESAFKGLPDDNPLVIWVNNPDGAIPAPAPRPKKPFIREVA